MKYLYQLIALTLTLFGADSSFAEKTLLTPGKSWTMAQEHIAYAYSLEVLANVSVVKDTIIDSREMTKLSRYFLGRPDEVEYFFAFEENGRVYEFPNYQLAMDFNLQKGDDFTKYDPILPNNMRIVTENTLEVNGRKFRELIIALSDDTPIDSWVEGVGCCNFVGTIYMYSVPISIYRLGPHRIVDCSENGQVIFTDKDFSIEHTSHRKLDNILKADRWWTLEVTLPDSSVVDARAEIIKAETIDRTDYATVKLTIEGMDDKEFDVYNFNHRLFVKDAAVDYPIMDMAATPAANNGGLRYELNPTRDVLVPSGGTFHGISANSAIGADNIYRMELLIATNETGILDAENLIGIDGTFSWVEGIGASKSMWITENGPQTILGYRMKECGQGNEILFTSRDFHFTPSVINEVKASKGSRTDGIYDLQGRHISNPGKGLYIVDGRKTLIR